MQPIGQRVGTEKDQYTDSPAVIDRTVYTDPAQHERELSEVFQKAWLAAIPSGALETDNQYLVWNEAGQSVVVVRHETGGLSAFHNVCQHRGTRIVREGGICTTGRFKCPWHGFSYDMTGRVTKVPIPESFPAEAIEGLRAPKVAVEEWNGMIWLNLDPEGATPLHQYLGEVGKEIDGYPLNQWPFVRERAWTVNANWKTALDAFNETWHVPFTHSDTVRGGLLWRDAAFDVMGDHSMMVIPLRRKKEEGIYRTDDHRGHMLCHYLAFPNVIYNCFPTLVEIFGIWPIDRGTCRIVAYMFMRRDPEMSEMKFQSDVERAWSHFCAVVEEDVEVLNEAGKVYDSLGYSRNLFNSAECRLTSFHQSIAEWTGAPEPRRFEN
jgi:choline monooxygenase